MSRMGMGDATIPLHGIRAATFKAMLRFMYTDAACPEEEETDLGDSQSASRALQDLLAAADIFQLDRLKILCATELWNNVSVDTVASTLICAEMYNCPQLKRKCIG
jgi:speckle-type POZ protein